jgi:hypothetical protein
VLASFSKRGSGLLDLIDGLSSREQVESPVSVSESPLFQRKYSSVYDVLREGKIDENQLRKTLYAHQPGDAGEIAGYAVYDKQGPGWKVVVADSLYCNYIFLGVFLLVQTVVGLVRIRRNQVLYEDPPVRQPHQKGRPRTQTGCPQSPG